MRQSFSTPVRNSGVAVLTPPSPWMGSRRMAQVEGIDGVGEGAELIEGHVAEAGENGREAFFDFLLTGSGDASKGPAVEGFIEADDLRARLAALRVGGVMPKTPSKFDKPIIGLGAGIGEKGFPRNLDEVGDELGEVGGGLGMVKIGNVNEGARLFLNGVDHHGMAMAEGADRNTSAKVEVALTLIVPHAGTFPFDQSKRKAGVGR